MGIGLVRRGRNSSAPNRGCFAGLCMGLVGLACARADDAPDTGRRTDVEHARQSVPTTTSASGRRDIDAGALAPVADASAACTGPECPECPAPHPNQVTAGQPVWSRSPEGDCCRYDNPVAAPVTWPYFETEEACQSDCRCSILEDFIEDVGLYATARTSLDCRCDAESCPTSLPQAEQLMCGRGYGGVQRIEGCGRVLVVDRNGYAGDGWVFEALLKVPGDLTSLGLVGAIKFGDVHFAPCQTSAWVAGRDFDCDSAVACQLCGESPGDPVPPCAP